MEETNTNPSAYQLLGGRLCLDFANTADWHAGPNPVEFLTSYPELVRWSQRTGILTGIQAQQLLAKAAAQPRLANEVLERTIKLREAVYRIFAAVARNQAPLTSDLAIFNAEMSRSLIQTALVHSANEFSWEWNGPPDALDRLLAPVLRDVADLLTSPQLDRVGQCADDNCGWLFLDTSRNRSRRWCSMDDCGNRAKARRHYLRSRDPGKSEEQT